MTKRLDPTEGSTRKFARDFEEPVRNAVKRLSPICVVYPSRRACRADVSSTEIQGAVANPARKTCASSAANLWALLARSRTTCRLEMTTPMPVSSAVSRSVVTCPRKCSARMKRWRPGPNPPAMPAVSAPLTVFPKALSSDDDTAWRAPANPDPARQCRRAFEPRSCRRLSRQHHLLGDRDPRQSRATPTPGALLLLGTKLRLGRALHPRGFVRRPARQLFQARDLVLECSVFHRERRHLLAKPGVFVLERATRSSSPATLARTALSPQPAEQVRREDHPRTDLQANRRPSSPLAS